MDLDIHPASEDERLQAYRNVFDVWPQAETLEEHVQRRLASVQHNRAEWFVGSVDGRVAASLACYPLEFWHHGQTVPGMAIGSVHTLADYRGRGFAPQLIRWVEEYQRLTGVRLSLLYSDIDPEYYARLGYIRCPSHVGWADPREVPRRSSSTHLVPEGARVELIRKRVTVAKLTGTDRPTHQSDAFSFLDLIHVRNLAIHRSFEYFDYLWRKQPEDRDYDMLEPCGKTTVMGETHDNHRDIGYVRVTHEWKLSDFAVMEDDDERLDDLFGHVMRQAAEGGAERVGGWMPNSPVTRKWFDVQPRTMEITMLKSLDDSLELTDDDIAAADWFCEIDHV